VPKIGRKVKIFSALEVANICGVVNQTAINWIKNGHLKAFTTPGGQYRIYAKDLAAFLDNRGMNDSGEALQVLLERSNWSNLLIAVSDIALNNRIRDEIAAAFPDFTIVQAFNAFDMGFKLAGEKPGLIFLDGELTGIESNKLLQLLKGDPVFGKPFIFLLDNNFDTNALHESADGILAKPPNIEDIIKTIKGLEKQAETSA
jgi:excisionase family DNA binding protein